MHDSTTHASAHAAEMPRETEGLPEAGTTQVIELAEGRHLRARDRAGQETNRRRDGADARATTARFPDPTLKVTQGSTITVNVTNRGDIDATVHWHGLRLENRYDGTHDTQAPIPVGESLHLPCPCPRRRRLLVPPSHSRGLRPGAGPLRKHPRDTRRMPDYWPQANREPGPDARRHPDRRRTTLPRSRSRRSRRARGAPATRCSRPVKLTCR